MFIRRALGMVLFSLLAAAGLWWWLQPPPVAVTVKVAQRGAVEATVVNTRAGTAHAAVADSRRAHRLSWRQGR